MRRSGGRQKGWKIDMCRQIRLSRRGEGMLSDMAAQGL